MRIGIEAQRVFREKKHGMDFVALELIRHLQQIDEENEYVIFVKDGPDACIEETKNFRVVKVPGISYPDWEQYHLARAAKKAKVDLLHLTSNTAPLRSSMPTLITLHDIIYLERISFKGTAYQNFGNLYRRWVVPPTARKAKKLITVSEFEKDNILSQMPELQGKIEVAYNGVNPKFRLLDQDDEVRKMVRSQYQLPEQFIFFLGNMAPKKNIRGVLKAFAQYQKEKENPLPLLVAETKEEELIKLLDELGLQDIRPQIKLTGYIPQDLLPVFYNLCEIFLYPSLRESFGMPIVEAMASGAAVITSDTSSMPEVAGGAALLVDPFIPQSITQAMYQLLDNPRLKEQKQMEGLENTKRFSWEKHASDVLSLYQELVNQDNRRKVSV
jgi:glycosyltransferase involved in cell wall biosynthesis